MSRTLFDRCGWDPVEVHARLYGYRPGGITVTTQAEADRVAREFAEREQADREARARERTELEARAVVKETPDPPPVEVKAEAEENPHRSREGGDCLGEDPGAAGADLPETREPEPHELVVKWMNEHWDTILAMAQAGEAPERAPPPAPPEPGVTLAAPPEPQRPAEPPYVEPDDRWTKRKMAEFLRQLAATQNVSASARAVKMSRNSAYRLRNRLKGQPFDVAWEAAFRHGYDNLAHSALELALEGEEVHHYYHGELVATHRKRNPQLMVQLLKMRNRAGAPMLGRYGAAAEYYSERWDGMLQRIETGSATWHDEQAALGAEERAALGLPAERNEADRIIERNRPDDAAKNSSRA